MAMIFTMVMAMKEELDNIVLDVKRAEEAEIEERKRKEEEAEQAKFNGTKVTVESFLEWKKKFDAEMKAKEAVLQAQRRGNDYQAATIRQPETGCAKAAEFLS